MQSTERTWPEEMGLRAATDFVTAHGLQLGRWELSNGNNGWPKPFKLPDRRSRRWRKAELEAAIALKKQEKQ